MILKPEPEPHEQKIIPISEAMRPEVPQCSCSNHHQPWLLDGRWVVSTDLGCRIHANNETKWMTRRMEVEA
jgi:hypothetical protein